MPTSHLRRRGSGTLVFDGDCGFCTTSAGWARRIAPGVVTVAWQLADLPALGVQPAAAAKAVQYVDDHGRVSSGAEAIARLLTSRDGLPAWIGRALMLPGIRGVAALAYRIVSANRHRLPGGTPACKAAGGGD